MIVSLELSTYCNASCPQCPRPYAVKNKWLKKEHVYFDTFKKWFPEETLHQISYFDFNGTFGDAGMNPDLPQIVNYCLMNEVNVHINTNGSIRDPYFWEDLAFANKIHKGNLKILFDIDGSTQEIHEKYRVGTKLDKILDNMKAASEYCDVGSLTIVFKHNQDDVDNIINLANNNGASWNEVMESGRFKHSDTYAGLERTTDPKYMADPNKKGRPVRDLRHNITKEIKCRAQIDNSIRIGVHGYVFPCCFLPQDIEEIIAHDMIWMDVTNKSNYVMMEYMKEKHKFNLNNHNLFDIISNEWFTKTLPESFKKDPHWRCVRTCGIVKNS